MPTLNGEPVYFSHYLTEERIVTETARRSWRVRLCSWPWRPWAAAVTITRTIRVPSTSVYKIGSRYFMHPEGWQQMRDQSLRKYTNAASDADRARNTYPSLVCLLLVLLLPHLGYAQTPQPAQPLKPVGAFGPADAPAWVSFGALPDWASDADLIAARARCQASGFRWIVQLGYAQPLNLAIGPHAAQVRARFDTLGLSPCVVAMTIWEEWYEHWGLNEYAAYGLPATVPESVAIPVIHAWAGEQHRQARAATGWPVIWLTTWASSQRPVPAWTDYVALDTYTACGGTWLTSVGPAVLAAEQATAVPLIRVPQWFQATGPAQDASWACGPPADAPAWEAAVLARPRWVALWGFLWQSRPWADLLGLADLPILRAHVESALGVRR